MTKSFTLALTLIAAVTSATAAEQVTGYPADFDMSQVKMPAPRSRAEVIADLLIYRRSGLAALESTDSPDVFSNAHDEAQARYFAMRSSAEFKQLVTRIATERGEIDATAARMPDAMPR